MEFETKKYIIYSLSVLLITLGCCLIASWNDNTELSKVIQDKNTLINGLNKRDSTTNYKAGRIDMQNLILRSYITGDKERELKKDRRYLKLRVD